MSVCIYIYIYSSIDQSVLISPKHAVTGMEQGLECAGLTETELIFSIELQTSLQLARSLFGFSSRTGASLVRSFAILPFSEVSGLFRLFFFSSLFSPGPYGADGTCSSPSCPGLA